MSLNASLKNRVRRLEQMRSRRSFDLGAFLSAERRRVDAMTREQQDAESLMHFDASVDALLAPLGPEPSDPRMACLRRSERRWTCEHLADLQSLEEPDAPAPLPDDYSEANVRVLWAWQAQQRRRGRARNFLQQIERARGLYTPRHWPLSAELINLARPRAHQENAHGAA